MTLTRRTLSGAAVLLALALAGCSTTKLDEAPVETRNVPADGSTTGSGTAGAGAAGTAQSGVTTVDLSKQAGGAATGLLAQRTVYFDFDSFVVKDEYRPLVEAHARYLVANRGARMTIQGNTDERGSREYNIALGQKRADAIKRTMTLLGAQEAQIETVSFGKEKPKNPGHDEAAWAENRRGDILYAGE